MKLSVQPSRWLEGEIDVEARLDRVPSDFLVKGMFFTHLVELLGTEWDAVSRSLVSSPDGGRYLPFRDYPQRDYSRVAYAASQHLFPKVPAPEAARRVARLDFQAFASSRIGRISLTLISDAETALSKIPQLYALSIKGGQVTGEPIDDGFRLHYRDFYGWVDCYPIGTIEGFVMHYGENPRIDVEVMGDNEAVYEVRW